MSSQLCITPELLQALGMDPATIRDQVIDAIVARVMGDGEYYKSELAKQVQKQVDAHAAAYFKKVIGPITKEMVEKVDFPETNRYGEPKGARLTLREHLAKRAETYLSEPVDSNGKAAWERGSSYDMKHTRLVHLVRDHFRYTMQGLVEKLMTEANRQLAGGIEGSVKLTLESILKNFKVTTKVDA